MNGLEVFPIGFIENAEGNVCIRLASKYAAGLKGLAGYSHALVLWWADGCDDARNRNTFVERKPYKKGPEELGVFALRSPGKTESHCGVQCLYRVCG